ncbi:MAG: RHS repeat domain-containing protein [Alistipes onderdonkii]|mgnify:CR=1 FL=1
MKHFLQTALISLLGIYAHAAFPQSFDNLTDPPLMQYSPTPQTWSFIRYGNTPVDYYTGTAQADVPLYEYSDPDFQFSLSAGYASNGFLPQRQTGILGLNWFLNCGGTITREIRGLDDFGPSGSSTGHVNGFLCGTIPYDESNLMNLTLGHYSMEAQAYTDASSHESEVNADIFHFSFMGHSGTFHYDGTRQVRIYNTQEGHGTYRIKMTDCQSNSEHSTITITTGDGYTYVFGGKESALERMVKGTLGSFGNYQLAAGPANPVVSWMLTSVIAPNGRKISFTYDGANHGGTYINRNTKHPYYVTSFQLGNGTGEQTPSHHRQASITRTTYLTKISVGNALNIELTYLPKGCYDINDTPASGNPSYDGTIAQELKKLDRIDVTCNRETLRTCRFGYKVKNDRLILKTIDVSGTGTYKMDYHEEYDYPGLTTADIDFWGYYNGKGNDYDYINPMIIATPDLNMNESISLPFKNPDWTYSIIGCLRRIVYPTKGFTEFEYEANRVQYIVLRRDYPQLESEITPVPDPEPQEPGIYPGDKYLAALNDYSTLFKDSDETGGVRIRKITDHDTVESYQAREYEYTDNNARPSGIVMYFPRFYGQVLGNHMINVPLLQYPANTFDKSHIGYGSVREIYADGSSVRYEFNNYKTHPDNYKGQVRKLFIDDPEYLDIRHSSFYDNILREPNSLHYQRGKLHTKTMYNVHGQKVKCEEIQYQDDDSGYSGYVVASGPYVYSVKKPAGNYQITGKITTDYFGTAALSTSISYSYNQYGQPNHTMRIPPDNHCYFTDIKYLHETGAVPNPETYPLDYPAEIINYSTPEPSSDYCNITSATKCEYTTSNGMTKPSVVSKAELKEPLKTRRAPALDVSGLKYTPKTYYDTYDATGNPLQIRDAEGTLYGYVWGYGGLYPVAKIMNASQDKIRLALGNSGNRPLDGGLTQQQIDNLYAIEGAYIDIYEYRPCVGIIRHFDPSRKEFRYEYDLYGRLTGVHDRMGTLQKYEYHF